MESELFAKDSDLIDEVGPRMGMRRDPCAVCGMPVFLAEKLVISRTPYHRTCFRCARCKNQLTPGNYYETEEGQYCCETCPDEEETTKSPLLGETIYHESNRDAMLLIEERENVKPEVYKRSLSDEEKSSHKAQLSEKKLVPQEDITSPERRKNSEMRLSFMTKNLLADNTEDNATEISDKEEKRSSSIDEAKKGDRREPKGTLTSSWVNAENVNVTKTIMPARNKYETTHTDKIVISDVSNSTSDDTVKRANGNNSLNQLDLRINDKESNTRTTSLDTANYEHTKNSNDINIPLPHDAAAAAAAAVAAAALDDSKNSTRTNTKDTIGPDIDTESLSLVQKRLKLFETRKVENFAKNASNVVSSSSASYDERSNYLSATNNDEKDSVIEPNIGTSTEETWFSTNEEEQNSTDGVIGVVTPSVDATSQENKIISPPVPKRSNLKQSRKYENPDLKKSEVTVLNASGIDLSENEENYPSDLNPFDCDDINNDDEQEQNTRSEDHEKLHESRLSTNPFGSSEDEEDDQEDEKMPVPPRPATRNIHKPPETPRQSNLQYENEAPPKRRLKAPQINFNPFLSDDEEEHDTDDEHETLSRSSNTSTPVPKPRTIKQAADSFLSPWKNDLTRGDIYASNTSLASTGSTSTTGGTYRKKKPAPPPPVAKELFNYAGDSLASSNSFIGTNNSLRSTPKARKAKPAPPPPLPTSTPCSTNLKGNITIPESPIIDCQQKIETRDYELWKDPKNDKDAANRTTQSMTTVSCDETNPYDPYSDKSVQGKWKRKKGPAPARPIPHRRKIKVMSLKDVKLELDEIEMQQQGLEKQGVRLEQLIRDKAETGSAAEDTNLRLDVEELVLELFALVNEKNELFRRQAELMLLRRQQRLEEEHADIEYQIRCLLCQPEATKTDFDKQREEMLIQRLVEIVERRNEIVECLEMDRRREVEEDRSINTQMGIYAAKNKGDFAKELEEHEEQEEERNRLKKSKKTKLKEKAKEKILRKVHKKDADKDVDETEVKLKRQNKKKWF